MGKYDHLNSVQRIFMVHRLLDDATLILKNLRTDELADAQLVAIGVYLAGIHEAWVASEQFIAYLRARGIIELDNPYESLKDQPKGDTPF